MSTIKKEIQEFLKEHGKDIIIPVQNRIHIYPSGKNKTTYTKRQHDDIGYFCVSLFIRASKMLTDYIAKEVEQGKDIKTKGIAIKNFGHILIQQEARRLEKVYTKKISDFLIKKKGEKQNG